MNYLSLIQAVLAIALVAVVGYIGVQQGTVKGLRETNQDLRDRDADRDKLIREAGERIVELESAVKVLTATVTGEAHLVAISGQVSDLHTLVATNSASLLAAIERWANP